MNPLAAAALLGGGGLLLLGDRRDLPAGQPSTPDEGAGGGDAAPSAGLSPRQIANAANIAGQYDGSATQYSPVLAPIDRWNSATVSGYGTEVEEEVLKRAQAELDAMSAAARREACERLKDEYPASQEVQGLDCDSDFQAILNVCAFAAGTWACGPTCGALAVLVSVYFGASLSDWCSDAWDSISDKYGDTFEDIGSNDEWIKENF